MLEGGGLQLNPKLCYPPTHLDCWHDIYYRKNIIPPKTPEQSTSEFRNSEDQVLDLTCAICSAVATDPMKHEACQKLFCTECLERHGEDKPSAYCKIEGGTYYPNYESK